MAALTPFPIAAKRFWCLVTSVLPSTLTLSLAPLHPRQGHLQKALLTTQVQDAGIRVLEETNNRQQDQLQQALAHVEDLACTAQEAASRADMSVWSLQQRLAAAQAEAAAQAASAASAEEEAARLRLALAAAQSGAAASEEARIEAQAQVARLHKELEQLRYELASSQVKATLTSMSARTPLPRPNPAGSAGSPSPGVATHAYEPVTSRSRVGWSQVRAWPSGMPAYDPAQNATLPYPHCFKPCSRRL